MVMKSKATVGSLVRSSQPRGTVQNIKNHQPEPGEFLENAVVPMHWIAPNGTILWANQAELALLGYPRSEYVGQNLSAFLVDPSALRDILRRIKRNEELRNYEVGLRCKDGSVRHVGWYSGALTKNGTSSYSHCFVVDLTDKKRAEEEAQLLSAIVESSDDAIASKDLNGIVTSWNKAAERIFGYKAAEIVGQPITMIIPPELYGDEPQILATIRSGERIEHFETVRIAKNGKRLNVSLTISPVRDHTGRIVGAAKIVRDITEKKHIEADSQHLAAIVQSSDDAIASKDLHGIVTSWNKAAERIFGYKAEEIIGRPVTTIIPPELHDDEPRILAKISAGQRIEHFETVRVTKAGDRLNVSLTISPIKDKKGNIIGAAKIVRDVTAQKKMEAALHVSERLASVGRMAATVAHEINNPLEAITNFIYLAKHQPGLSEKATRYLTSADQELRRVAHIAQQTLGFYRDNSKPATFSIAKVLEDVLALYERKFKYKSLKLEKRIRPDLKIYALEGELKQVLSNLIANAADASREGGRLVISARATQYLQSGPGVIISVADTGTGIPKANKVKLFAPFFTSKQDVGTGLGLWITKDLLEKKGGRIRFRSRDTAPSGTVMTIFVPAVQAPQTDKRAILQ